jgi:hypothetical protein
MTIAAGTQGTMLRNAIRLYEPLRVAAKSDPSSAARNARDNAWNAVNTRYRDYSNNMQAGGQNYDTLDKVLKDERSQRP